MFAGAVVSATLDADGNPRDPSLILGAENHPSSLPPEPQPHPNPNISISTDFADNFHLRAHHTQPLSSYHSHSHHLHGPHHHGPSPQLSANTRPSGLTSLKGRISRHNSASISDQNRSPRLGQHSHRSSKSNNQHSREAHSAAPITHHKNAADKYVMDAADAGAAPVDASGSVRPSSHEFSSLPGSMPEDAQQRQNNLQVDPSADSTPIQPVSPATAGAVSPTSASGAKSPQARARWGTLKTKVSKVQDDEEETQRNRNEENHEANSQPTVANVPHSAVSGSGSGGRDPNDGKDGRHEEKSSKAGQIPELGEECDQEEDEPIPPAQALIDRLLTEQAGASDSTRLDIARVYIDDAIHFHEPSHRIDPLGIRVYKINSHWFTRTFVLFVIIINCLLSYWEYDPDISAGLLIAVEEITLLILLAATLMARFCYPLLMPWPNIRGDLWNWFKIAVIIICFFDSIIYYNARYTFRIARLLRVYFVLSYSPDTRAQTIQVCKTIFYIVIPFFMLLYLTFFETVIGILLFHDQESITNPTPGQLPYFVTLYESYTDIFALNTASNFPDISFPAIKRFGLKASFYFVVCLIIGLYIALNLLIAVTYNVYRKHAVSGTLQKFVEFRGVALRAAFRILAGSEDGKITGDQWESLYIAVNPSNLSPADARSLARKHLKAVQTVGEIFQEETSQLEDLDDELMSEESLSKLQKAEKEKNEKHGKSHNGETPGFQPPKLVSSPSKYSFSASVIDLDEFFELSNSFYVKIAREEDLQDFPVLTDEAKKFESWFEHPYCQYARAVFITSNCGFFIDNFQTSTDSDGLFYPPWHQAFDSLFLAYLIIEIGLSIYYLTWRRYWHYSWRRIDFAIVMASFLGKILIEFTLQPIVRDRSLTVFRAACLFRVIRLLRVPIMITKFRHGMKAVVKILKSLSTLLMFLLSILYVFAIIGIAIWSGHLKNNPDLAGSEYDDAGYGEHINFDDFSHAMYACFHLMAVNNYYLTINAMVTVRGRIGFAYFLAFYLCVGIATINLVIAFVIEAIQHAAQQVEKEEKAKEKRRMAAEEKKRLELQAKKDGNNGGGNNGGNTNRSDQGSNRIHPQNNSGLLTNRSSQSAASPGQLTDRNGGMKSPSDRLHATIKMAGAMGMFAKDIKKEGTDSPARQLKSRKSRGDSIMESFAAQPSGTATRGEQSERRPRLGLATSEHVSESESELDDELGMTADQMAGKIKFTKAPKASRKSVDMGGGPGSGLKSYKTGLVIRS